MSDVFAQILHLCWSATVLALAVMAVRLVFRRMPKKIACLLWLLVALRLILPWSWESPVSLQPVMPSAAPMVTEKQDTIPNNAASGDSVQAMGQQTIETERTEVDRFQVKKLLPALWLSGVLVMLSYMAISYRQIYRRVAEAVQKERGIYESDLVESPFVLGFFRPRIYLPADLSGENREAVLIHERCHIRRRDYWWKPLAFVLLSVYWFNPVLWVAYVLLCRDIEGACDERVLDKIGTARRANYSRALVECAVHRANVMACPVAFGEVEVKGRVKNILSYKKPAFWVILLAVATCIMLAVCFLTDPRDPALDSAIHEAVLAENKNPYCIGQPVESHKVFQVQRSGEQVTVYAMVLYQELLPDTSEDCGGHCAVKMIFTGNRGDGYELQKYWVPEDGDRYVPSIRENFPVWLWGSATDTQRTIAKQKADCLTQFIEDEHAQKTRDAMKIYNKRTPYVGDNAAVGAILDILGAGEYGIFTYTLQTDKLPYGIALHYDFKTIDSQRIYAWANRAMQVAYLTLGLVENASWVSWDIVYPSGEVFPGGRADVNDTILQPDDAYYSLSSFMQLQSKLNRGGGAALPDGTYTPYKLVYLADNVQDPGWEKGAVLTQKTTVDEKLVDGAQSVTITMNWKNGEETLHDAVCISTFDELTTEEMGGLSPDASHTPDGTALLAGDGVDSGLRIWQVGSYYFMGRVDEQGQTLYVYRCEWTA